jgi:hypothetical protein
VLGAGAGYRQEVVIQGEGGHRWALHPQQMLPRSGVAQNCALTHPSAWAPGQTPGPHPEERLVCKCFQIPGRHHLWGFGNEKLEFLGILGNF